MKCEIIFDTNQYGVYFCGDSVNGKVILRADKPKHVKEIVLKMVGYARTSWTESTTITSTDAHGHSTSITQTTTYGAKEDYLDFCINLTQPNRDQTLILDTGTHMYNFNFQIPINCPTSFESQNGHIRYKAKVILIRPWKFDQTHTVGFTVLKLVDLNYESPVLRLPTNMETFKEFCCGPCRSKPLHITADVPQTGYVPGQAIRVNINIDNPTNVQIKEVKTALNLEVTCFGEVHSSKKIFTSTCIAKCKSNIMNKNCQLTLTEWVQVPATPPTCLSLCNIIHISYVLEITTSVNGPHVNPTIKIPITIGNVPLSSFSLMQREATAPNAKALSANDNTLPVLNSTISPTAPQLPDMNLPPPSYEMAMYMSRANMNEDEKHPMEEMDFAPRYPVYNIPDPLNTEAKE